MAPASLTSVSDCSVSMKLNSATGSDKSTTPQSPKRRETSFASPIAASSAPSLCLVSSSTHGSLHAVVDVVRLLEQRKVIDSALSPVGQDFGSGRPGCFLMEATPALVDPPTPMTIRSPACGGGVMVTGGGDGVSELSQSDSQTVSIAPAVIKTAKEIGSRKPPSSVFDKHVSRTTNKMTPTISNSVNGDRLLNHQSSLKHCLVSEHRRNCLGDSADVSVQKLKSNHDKSKTFGANASSICDERPSNGGNFTSVCGSNPDINKNGTSLENGFKTPSSLTSSLLPSASASFSSPSTASSSSSASISSSSQLHFVSMSSTSSSSSSSLSVSKPLPYAPSLSTSSSISASRPLSACQCPISSNSASQNTSPLSNSSLQSSNPSESSSNASPPANSSSSFTLATSTSLGFKCSMPLTSLQVQPTVHSPSQTKSKSSLPATSASGNGTIGDIQRLTL